LYSVLVGDQNVPQAPTAPAAAAASGSVGASTAAPPTVHAAGGM